MRYLPLAVACVAMLAPTPAAADLSYEDGDDDELTRYGIFGTNAFSEVIGCHAEAVDILAVTRADGPDAIVLTATFEDLGSRDARCSAAGFYIGAEPTIDAYEMRLVNYVPHPAGAGYSIETIYRFVLNDVESTDGCGEVAGGNGECVGELEIVGETMRLVVPLSGDGWTIDLENAFVEVRAEASLGAGGAMGVFDTFTEFRP